MARINAFTTALAIALVSDYGLAFNLPANATAYWVNELETKGFDATMPRLIHSLYQGVATANARAAAAEKDAKRLSQTLVGWDANDMAISAEAASYGQHAARAAHAGYEVFAPAPATAALIRAGAEAEAVAAIPATTVWLTTRRVPVMARLVVGLGIPQAAIIADVDRAIAAGHTANDALGAFIARNGGGGVTDAKRAAARAMGFEI